MKLKMLIILISLLSIAGCKEVSLGEHEVCGYSRGQAFCGLYSFDKVKFVTPVSDAPLSKIEGGFILTKESWLKGLRPKIKEMLRERKDSKKKKLFIDGFLGFRETYEL